jgi:hypothetical protein
MRSSKILLGALLSLSCNSKPSGDAATTGGAGGPVTSAGATTASGPSGQAASASAGVQASASAAPAGSSPLPVASTSASARGLLAPGNDAEAVSLIKRILRTCKWERGNWAGPCEALDEWGEWNMLGLHTDDKLRFALCEDSELKVRQLCSMGLQTSVGSTHDPKVATAILDAFEKERDPVACLGMARAVGHIRVEKAGSEERIKQAARNHPVTKCRAVLVEEMLFSNESFYDFVVDLAKTDKEPEVRGAAASALRSGSKGKPERSQNSCKLWLEMLDERDQPFTGKVAWLLAQDNACADRWDAMLQGFEALVTAGKVRPPLGNLACNVHEQKRAKPEQKTQVIETAKKLVESDKSPTSERISALRCITKFDPNGKAFAARFVDSPVAELKAVAVQQAMTSPSASGSGQAAIAAGSASAKGVGSAPSPLTSLLASAPEPRTIVGRARPEIRSDLRFVILKAASELMTSVFRVPSVAPSAAAACGALGDESLQTAFLGNAPLPEGTGGAPGRVHLVWRKILLFISQSILFSEDLGIDYSMRPREMCVRHENATRELWGRYFPLPRPLPSSRGSVQPLESTIFNGLRCVRPGAPRQGRSPPP